MTRARPHRRATRGISSITVGVDTGGTFTDLVAIVDGSLRVHKVLSTPDDPAAAVKSGIEVMLAGARPGLVTYSSTVATNALLEKKGARVAIITNAGFEDLIEIGRQNRDELYALAPSRPEPLVPRARRIGVAERTLFDAKIPLPLTRAELDRVRRAAERSGARAFAICLLHSYANPKSEEALARALAPLGRPLSVSHRILAEYREYERFSTTVVNAYVAPRMTTHLANLERRLSGARLRIMQSGGSAIGPALARAEPVRTILSGPAAGVIGAAAMAREIGTDRFITFDMGGTSTDVSLFDRRAKVRTLSYPSGYAVRTPVIDIHTVGAGGGSLARFDRGGALRVGPESAGAEPGPICYGRGTKPTVTDAHLVLGRIVAEGFLGGDFRLDLERAKEWMARARGTMETTTRFAQGILDVVETNMEKAIRVISIERGHDPRDYALVAFGGAGGLHACGLAAALEIPRVLIPKFPGGLSALGILRADVVKDFSKTILLPVESARAASEALRREFAQIDRQASAAMRGEGFRGRQMQIEHLLDLRYIGQAYELSVLAGGDFVQSFHRAHEKRYGYADAKRAVEIVNVRARAIGLTPKPALPKIPRGGSESRGAVMQERGMFFGGRAIKTKIYDRSRLRAGNRFRGPAIVAEYSATTVVLPEWGVHVDACGNLVMELAR